jgi:hypothetical protein
MGGSDMAAKDYTTLEMAVGGLEPALSQASS